MICPHCHNEHADAVKFCPHTGKAIYPPAPPPARESPAVIPAEAAPNERACRNCGRTIAAKARFCPYCAADQESETFPDEPPVGELPQRPRGLWIALAGLGLIAVCALAGVLVYYGWKLLQGKPAQPAAIVDTAAPAAAALEATTLPPQESLATLPSVTAPSPNTPADLQPSATPQPPAATLPPTPTVFPTPEAAWEWMIEAIDKSSQQSGYFTSLAFDSQGAMHVVHLQENFDIVWYGHNKNQGKWQFSQVIGKLGYGLHLSLAVDSKGYPHLAFHTKDTKKNIPRLFYFRWTEKGITGPFQNAEYQTVNTDVSLALGPDDQPHFAFMESYSNNAVYARLTGNGYENTPLGKAAPDCRSFPIVVDAAGVPHLIFQSQGSGLLYRAYVNGSWLKETVDASLMAGEYSALALGPDGSLYAAYSDAGALKVARRGAGGWETPVTVDDSGNSGMFPTIAVGDNADVHISYYDAARRALKYALFRGGAWRIDIVDESGDVGQWNSLALTPSGAPVISYLDETQQDLKLATAYPR